VITFLNDFNEFGKRDKSIECVIIDQVFQNSQKEPTRKIDLQRIDQMHSHLNIN
jgi:hypothetical protein